VNRAQRRTDARTHPRTARTATALGSAAVLASAGAGAAVVFTQSAASANAPIVVDSLTDDGSGGTTLREAINQANTDSGQDEITFSVTGTITLIVNLPGITDALHITGPGASSLTIDGVDQYRVFSFQYIDTSYGTNAVSGLTITHGNADGNNPDDSGGAIQLYHGDAEMTISDVVLTDNYSGNDGGAIQFGNFDGDATITRATVTDNYSVYGGGGLYVDSDTGMALTIVDSIFTGNTAGGDGGGLYFDGDITSVTIVDSVISGNTAGVSGGGIKSYAPLTIVGTTIADNTAIAEGGGGIWLYDAPLVMANSTVSGNSAGGYGGGLYLYGAVTIVQSTISDNTAGQNAGGVYVGASAGAAILLSTITDNEATGPVSVGGNELAGGILIGGGSPLVLSERHRARASETNDKGEAKTRGPRTTEAPIPPGTVQAIGVIVAGNTGNDVGSYGDPAGAVTVQSLGSILGTVETPLVTVTDAGGTQTGVTADALELGPLADNGGPTQTHALLPGSVAIDAGPAAADLPTFDGSEYDQRGTGYARVVNGKVDVGAFEVQTLPAPGPTPEPTFTG